MHVLNEQNRNFCSYTVQRIRKATFTNNVSDNVEGIPVSEVKPGGKDEQKRFIHNASSDKTETLLEFWGEGRGCC